MPRSDGPPIVCAGHELIEQPEAILRVGTRLTRSRERYSAATPRNIRVTYTIPNALAQSKIPK